MTAGRLVLPALRWRDDTGFAHEIRAIEEALACGAGGFILFGGTLDAVRDLTAELRRGAARPLLIASDLERGAGQQVAGLPELPPPLALASLDDLAVVRGAGLLTGASALRAGINWVLAPVADLDLEPENPIVQTRAFGDDPGRVAECVSAWVTGCQTTGALACVKHFPGHGRTTVDSHDALPIVTADRRALLETDLVPFAAAVRAGVAAVMTAHVAFPALDADGVPATRSGSMLALLRERLGFEGLIASDALMMQGAAGSLPPAEAALGALRAGVDLLLYPTDLGQTVSVLERAAREVGIRRRIDAALERYERALGAAASAATNDPVEAGSSLALGDWLLERGWRRGPPPALRRPLDLEIIDDDVSERYPPSSDAGIVADTLRNQGCPPGRGGSRIVLVYCEPRASKGRGGLSPRSAAALDAAAGTADLIVVFAHPRVADVVPGRAAVLLAWHRQRLMQEALARWLARQAR